MSGRWAEAGRLLKYLQRKYGMSDTTIPQPAAMSDKQKIDAALGIILQYGGIDGAHHKTWVIDQVVRTLTGDAYPEWVREAKDGDDGPETYGWDEGIAP